MQQNDKKFNAKKVSSLKEKNSDGFIKPDNQNKQNKQDRHDRQDKQDTQDRQEKQVKQGKQE